MIDERIVVLKSKSSPSRLIEESWGIRARQMLRAMEFGIEHGKLSIPFEEGAL